MRTPDHPRREHQRAHGERSPVSGLRTKLPLRERRDRLLSRSAELRAQLGVELAGWRRPLGTLDQVRAAWHWLRQNPAWPLAAVAVVVATRPRRALRLLGSGLWAWRLWRRLQPRARSDSIGSPAAAAKR